MDALKAMELTVKLAFDKKMSDSLNSTLSYPHVAGMLVQMKDGDFDSDKLNRWLGWAQCAVVAAGCATLDDMKAINAKCAS